VDPVLGTYSTVSEQPNARKLRALATASRTRIEPLPEVPSVAESSYDHYGVDFWLGLFAPAKTSNETIFHSPIGSVRQMQGPEVRAKLVAQRLYPVEICGVDFAALLRKQYDDFGPIIREANIKAE
jgi:tripartite-type tricarboxylate transporter receptor subunit TctC